MLIEIGGGTRPAALVDIGIDPAHPVNAPAQRAQDTPWVSDEGRIPDGVADEVYASHVLEHIPRGPELIAVMNEAWRVLKPGGSFLIVVPLVGFTNPKTREGTLVEGWQPYADPTHVNLWWFPEALYYFGPGWGAHANYGIREWVKLGRFVDQSTPLELPGTWWTVRENGFEGVARLVKP